MRYFCSPNQKTVLRTRRIVELRSGPKDAKVAKKVPYLECGAVGKKSRFMKKSLIALAFGTLALGMAEFVMMGILPDVARDLGVSIPRAGDLISAYAIGVCVGAPATVLIARKRALKGILLALAALIVLGNVCASLAPDFWVLLAMRFVSGLPHGAFFGVGSIVAERVADPGHKTQAVSIMILGMTVANLFCVPLGTYLGSYLSWRLAFGMVGLWGIMALLLIARWVPALPALPDTGLKGQFRFLGSRAPWLILLATLLANGGVFCWYSYVTPTMTRVAGIPGQAMTAVMMVAGLGMDCEENGHPCIKHLESYREAKEMGLFLTAHAGEDGGADNIWDALLKLDVQRIDHGCRAAEHPELMEYLQEHQILCAMCPSGNVYSGAAASFEAHPLLTLLHSGVPVSISSDDPPYTCSMTEELILDAEKMGLTEAELIQIIRNGFAYSISGQHLLPQFDAWVERFQQEGAQ